MAGANEGDTEEDVLKSPFWNERAKISLTLTVATSLMGNPISFATNPAERVKKTDRQYTIHNRYNTRRLSNGVGIEIAFFFAFLYLLNCQPLQ